MDFGDLVGRGQVSAIVRDQHRSGGLLMGKTGDEVDHRGAALVIQGAQLGLIRR